MTAGGGLRGAPREAALGVRLALAGLGTWARSPRLMLLGAVPALVTAALIGVGLVVLATRLPQIGDAVASRVVDGDGVLASIISATAGLAVLIAAGVLAMATYTTVTLAVGQPFFEAISRQVDAAAGGLASPAPEEPWRRALVRGIGEGLLTILLAAALSLAVLLVGLIPVVGSASALTLGAVVGGRLLALELTASPMARRGLVARGDRAEALRGSRARSIAFGAVVFLAFLVPLGTVIVMPAAVAGATLLTRSVAPDGPPADR